MRRCCDKWHSRRRSGGERSDSRNGRRTSLSVRAAGLRVPWLLLIYLVPPRLDLSASQSAYSQLIQSPHRTDWSGSSTSDGVPSSRRRKVRCIPAHSSTGSRCISACVGRRVGSAGKATEVQEMTKVNGSGSDHEPTVRVFPTPLVPAPFLVLALAQVAPLLFSTLALWWCVDLILALSIRRSLNFLKLCSGSGADCCW
uniref:Uncharacterized protein n=1 Tax=Pseudictyota dubia TaxID=2749911 RepID=A0A7R9ZJI3_9STRA|mmetsp:Transcript_8914/g.16501  ORF Transcript_8914/g.16501 Transcript_8914/m.16501 type:complete len:199 (+) Transcript_8914:916-1512(+)